TPRKVDSYEIPNNALEGKRPSLRSRDIQRFQRKSRKQEATDNAEEIKFRFRGLQHPQRRDKRTERVRYPTNRRSPRGLTLFDPLRPQALDNTTWASQRVYGAEIVEGSGQAWLIWFQLTPSFWQE